MSHSLALWLTGPVCDSQSRGKCVVIRFVACLEQVLHRVLAYSALKDVDNWFLSSALATLSNLQSAPEAQEVEGIHIERGPFSRYISN